MKKTLQAELAKMSDVDFFELEHLTRFSRSVRNAISEYAMTKKEMAAVLGITEKKLPNVLTMSFTVDLRMIANFQAFTQQKAFDEAALKITTDKTLQGLPAIITKLEKHIERIDSTEKPKK